MFMPLHEPARQLLAQLRSLLNQLSPAAFAAPCTTLSGATIGQHTRHIIELFEELNRGYQSGLVNYEGRQRNRLLETSSQAAWEALGNLLPPFHWPDKTLALETDLSLDGSGRFVISTSFWRELVFNIEHTVHHMALIKVGVETSTEILLAPDFGVAASTLKHRQQLCAQ